eukprot:5168991-Pyramimonas_sp.AAC.1
MQQQLARQQDHSQRLMRQRESPPAPRRRPRRPRRRRPLPSVVWAAVCPMPTWALQHLLPSSWGWRS